MSKYLARRSPLILAVSALAVLGTLSPVGGVMAASTPQPPPVQGSAPAVPRGDLAIYGTGDIFGYHLYTSAASGNWKWRALATIQPGGNEDERWIGQQCLTGNGRTIAAVIAPWSANNSEEGMDSGAFTYAVDAATGAVRPLATDASLAYFDPGCGVDGNVALTSYLGDAQQPTRVTVLDAASGKVVRTSTIPAELTSAVEVHGQILAAEGADLVDVTSGTPRVLHRFGGQVADLRPTGDGGVDLTAAGTQVWHYAAGAGTRLDATGDPAHLRLLAGAAGRNLVLNAATTSPGSDVKALALPATLTPVAASSRGGVIEIEDTRTPASAEHGGDPDVAEWRPGAPAMARTPLPEPSARRALTLPSLSAAGRAADPSVAAMASAAETTVPQCAVPRNDIFKQVWQPDADQVRWAVNQAALGALQPPDNSIARPPANQDYTLNDGSYSPLAQLYPSQAFPLQNLVAGANPAITVPPLVMYGILAQESNWDQASWHAVPGRSGNPLVADYYGVNNPGNSGGLDYSYADCGYGIAQVTTGMQNAAYPGAQSPLPVATQLTLAVDYATNIAYAEQVLQSKWQQLMALGITMNNGDPTMVENWYAAIWAYNSGVHLQGPGNQGLGWFNNPANPIYPVGRHTFLHVGVTPTLGDAANPQQWPYQEKVFGWMEVPLTVNGALDYRGTYDWDTGTGSFLHLPGTAQFCNTTVNSCDPSAIGSTDPCPAENSSCWWDAPAQWVGDGCASSCVTDTPWNAPNGHEYYDVAGQPEPANAPLSATCALGVNTPVTDANGNLLPGTVLADDEDIPSQNPGGRTPNLMGCSTNNSALIPPASANASFSLLAPDGQSIDAATSPGEAAAIDLHQLGAGIGGHLFFTHTTNDPNSEVRGRWQATLPADTSAGNVYQIYAFVPDIAATTGFAAYEVSEPDCYASTCPGYEYLQYTDAQYNNEGDLVAIHTINQDSHTNQWVSLGYYLCGGPGGPSTCTLDVTLRALTPLGDPTQGADIAFNAVAFVPVPQHAYVALGDSYSSGEGVAGSNGDLAGYDDGTDVTVPGTDQADPGYQGNLCHRSALAWPVLLASAKHLPLVNLACSGSNLGDIDGTQYLLNQTTTNYQTVYHTDTKVPTPGTLVLGTNPPASQAGDNWISDIPNNENAGTAYFAEPNYQLDLLRALHPRLVTITIGGNDIGFADIITTCASFVLEQLPSDCQQDLWSGTSNGVSNRIQSLEPMLESTYKNIASAAGGANRVTVITYPSPVTYDPSGDTGFADCTGLYDGDRQWLVPEVAHLASVIQQAGASAGVQVIDIHTLFDNNGPCTAQPYVTAPDFVPISLINSTTSQLDNWFHPNQAGYAAMEKAIAAKITIPAS